MTRKSCDYEGTAGLSDLERKIYGEKGSTAQQMILHRRDQAGCKPGGWIVWLEEGRQDTSKREDEGKALFALMGKNEHEAEDRCKSQKAELAVLTPAKKFVKGPEVLCYWHDCNEKRREKYEDSAQ